MSFLDALFQSAKALRTTGDDVDVGDSAPPTAGQILVADDATHATWHDKDAVVDSTARAAAAAAQTTANTAVTNAAAAQTTANTGVTNAAAAQTTADAANAAAAAAQTTANAAVPKSLFDTDTMLYASLDNTPVALTVTASTIVGRKASGSIAAMSPTEAKVVLSLDNVTNDAQVNSAIGGYTAKSPVASADQFYLADSAASNAIKRATLADIIALVPTSTGNPYIDLPSSPNAFDDEFNSGSDDMATRGWTVRNPSGTLLTRSGAINPWDSTGPVGNTYWSTRIGSWMFLQAAPGVQLDISKAITLAAGDTVSIRTGGSYHFATGAAGRYNEIGFYALSGSALDAGNRVFWTVRDDPTSTNYIFYDMFTVTANVQQSGGQSRLPLANVDVRSVHFDSGTTHYLAGVNTGSNQVTSLKLTNCPASSNLTVFGFRNLFSTSGSAVAQLWAIDYVRRKTGNAWIAG